MDEVDAGALVEVGRARGRGHEQPAGQPGRVAEQPGPQVGAGQVDGGDGGAPAQQRPQRAHLGGGAEHDDGAALEAQPLGVVEHRADRLAQARLDDAVGHPGVELAAQVVAAEPVAAVGDGERGLGLALAAERLGGEQVGGAPGDAAERRLEPHLPAVGVAPAHPVVDRGEPGVGDGDGILGSGQPGLDQPAEVGEVAAAPVRLAAGPPPRRPGRRAAARRRRSPARWHPSSGDRRPRGRRRRWARRPRPAPAQPQTSAREGSARIAATSARKRSRARRRRAGGRSDSASVVT